LYHIERRISNNLLKCKQSSRKIYIVCCKLYDRYLQSVFISRSS